MLESALPHRLVALEEGKVRCGLGNGAEGKESEVAERSNHEETHFSPIAPTWARGGIVASPFLVCKRSCTDRVDGNGEEPEDCENAGGRVAAGMLRSEVEEGEEGAEEQRERRDEGVHG